MASLLAAAMAQMSTPKTALATMSDGVTNLFGACRRGTADANHLDDVHTWVSQPRHCGQHAGLADQTACGLWLGLGGTAQTNKELEEDKAEWEHGKSPPHPACIV